MPRSNRQIKRLSCFAQVKLRKCSRHGHNYIGHDCGYGLYSYGQIAKSNQLQACQYASEYLQWLASSTCLIMPGSLPSSVSTRTRTPTWRRDARAALDGCVGCGGLDPSLCRSAGPGPVPAESTRDAHYSDTRDGHSTAHKQVRVRHYARILIVRDERWCLCLEPMVATSMAHGLDPLEPAGWSPSAATSGVSARGTFVPSFACVHACIEHRQEGLPSCDYIVMAYIVMA